MKKLHSFAKNGHLNEIQDEIANLKLKGDLLDYLNLLDAQDKYTPLIWAAKNGCVNVLEYLVAIDGIDINKRGGWNDSTALIKATESNSCKCVQILLQSGANPDLSNNFRSTPLMIAAEKGLEEIAEILIHFHASTNLTNELGYSALILAAEHNHINIVSLLLQAKVEKDAINQFGKTALIMACEFNGFESVNLLLQNGANINIQSKRGLSGLMLACLKGNKEIVNLLLNWNANSPENNNKVDVNMTSHDGQCALMFSFVSQNADITRLLLDHGAKRFRLSPAGVSPLMKACEHGCFEAVQMLLDYSTFRLGESRLDTAFSPSKEPAATAGLLEGTRCRRCNNKLNPVTNQKHHCRHCGQTFCHSCSSFSLELPNKSRRDDILSMSKQQQQQQQQSRVCICCFEILTRTPKEYFQIRIDINMPTVDGSTSLHFAASKGHLELLLWLIDKGGNLLITNDAGYTPQDALGEFYVQNESKFVEEFIPRASKCTELLEMIPVILPLFPSPNTVLNTCFSRLLYGLKQTDDRNIISGLIYAAVALRQARKSNHLEAFDLKDKSSIIDGMLQRAIGSDCLEDESNIIRVFQDSKMTVRKNDFLEVSRGRAFLEGPLALCFEHKILSVMGTRQISIFVDQVFHGCLKSQTIGPIYEILDLFQIRSNCINWRSCPAFHHYVEGISKLALLIISSLLAIDIRRSVDYAVALAILYLGSVLHEMGELHNCNWDLKAYFDGIWNYLDVIHLGLLTGWGTLTIVHNFDVDYYHGRHYIQQYPHGNQTWNDVPWIKDEDIPHPPSKALLAISVIPLCIGLLRYFSPSRDLGTFILTVFAMFTELIKFAVVMCFCMIGFAIMFHSLFPFLSYNGYYCQSSFTNVEWTFITLFNAMLGAHDMIMFDGEPYHSVGITFFVIFKLFSQIILINLLIARFSATHDSINAQSLERWCLLKAGQVRQFLLIHESHPFCMLPAPLNLVISIFAPIHYLLIYLEKGSQSRRGLDEFQENATKVISFSGTIADIIVGLVVAVPCAVYEMYLCLQAVKLSSPKKTYHWILFWFFLLFPLIYLIFLFLILIRVFQVRSVIKLFDNGESNLEYNLQLGNKRPKSTPINPVSPGSGETVFSLNIIRVEGFKKPKLCLPKIYAVASFANQNLVTQPVTLLHGSFTFTQENHTEFTLPSTRNWSQEKIVIKICDDEFDTVVGIASADVKIWMANGRFEGNLPLRDAQNVEIAKIGITARVLYDINRARILQNELKSDKSPYSQFELQKTSQKGYSKEDKSKDSGSFYSLMIEEANLMTTKRELTAETYIMKTQISNKEYHTTPVLSASGNPVFQQEFIIDFSKNNCDLANATIVLTLFVQRNDEELHCLGTSEYFITDWVKQQGVFRASVDLFQNDYTVGTVSLVFSRITDPSKPSSKTQSSRGLNKRGSRRSSTTESHLGSKPGSTPIEIENNNVDEGDRTLRFSKEDRERIFYGIQEDYSYFTKNPYAQEIQDELHYQLEGLSKSHIENPLQAVHNVLKKYCQDLTILGEIDNEINKLVETPRKNFTENERS